jgi:hypothetical protein
MINICKKNKGIHQRRDEMNLQFHLNMEIGKLNRSLMVRKELFLKFKSIIDWLEETNPIYS